MYEIIILKEGYTSFTDDKRMKSCGTVTLVKGPKNILVDTGSPWDREIIITKLSEYSLSPSDIHYVVGTHGHVDHIGNLNLFTDATFIVSHDITYKNEYIKHDFASNIPYAIDTDVEVISTPGHTGADVSVIVHNTVHGTVAVAGDLFECEEDSENKKLWQDNSQNPHLQLASRNKILTLAQYIVPGHGPPFVVVESYKRQGSITEPDNLLSGEKFETQVYSVEEAE